MDKRKIEVGQSLVIVAMAFVGIVAFVGFAIDTGIIYLNRIWLGQAVDAASLAAGYDLPNIKGACARAVEYLNANDYIAGRDFEYDIIFPNVPDTPGGDPGTYIVNSTSDSISIPEDCSTLTVPSEHDEVHYQVQVVGRQQVPLIFMSILGFGEIEAGVDGLAERTARFDISLVLDNSGSMVYDTCGYYRTLTDENDNPITDDDGYSIYAGNNLYTNCKDITGDDFESYDTTDDLDIEWDTAGATDLRTPGGNPGHWVEMRAGGSNQAFLLKRSTAFDVRYPENDKDIALFFSVKNLSMGSNEFLEIHYRVWNGLEPLPDENDWLPLSRIRGTSLDSSWKEMGIVLPSDAANQEFLQIRFGTWNAMPTHGVGIDGVMFKSCPPVREGLRAFRTYRSGGSEGCPTGGYAAPMNAHIVAPEAMEPRHPIDGDEEPVTYLVEQPMFDVLRSTETFIDLIDLRRQDTTPPRAREDQFSLVTFSNRGRLLYDLTVDYEAIKNTLFTEIEGDSYTNLGDGMRRGLNTLVDEGRSNTIHYMVLVTDGLPNRYRDDGSGHSSNGEDPDTPTLNYIDEQVEYAKSQNVTVFTIGLGNPMTEATFTLHGKPANGMDLLEYIADETGGEAYHAPNTAELRQIFEWIAEAIFVRLSQ
jgi:hypothetical protein